VPGAAFAPLTAGLLPAAAFVTFERVFLFFHLAIELFVAFFVAGLLALLGLLTLLLLLALLALSASHLVLPAPLLLLGSLAGAWLVWHRFSPLG
jgi:hypothetical protein